MTRNPNWTRDEIILALDLYFRVDPVHTGKDNPEIVELSDLLNQLPIHAKEDSDEKFRNPNGVYMKLCNFLRFDPSYEGEGLKAGGKLEKEIWEEFSDDKVRLSLIAQSIRNNYQQLSRPKSIDEEIELSSDDEEFSEGRILTRIHKLRERNPLASKKKKNQVMKQTGMLECEACGFNFHEFYGDLGQGFAECHHTLPLSELDKIRKTKLSDLSIVCANCHRIIHRSRPQLQVQELREILESIRDEGVAVVEQ